jgi:hypothetical protein
LITVALSLRIDEAVVAHQLIAEMQVDIGLPP